MLTWSLSIPFSLYQRFLSCPQSWYIIHIYFFIIKWSEFSSSKKSYVYWLIFNLCFSFLFLLGLSMFSHVETFSLLLYLVKVKAPWTLRDECFYYSLVISINITITWCMWFWIRCLVFAFANWLAKQTHLILMIATCESIYLNNYE